LWAYRFDEDSGQLTPLSTPSFSAQGYGPININFNVAGTRAYVTNVGSNSITQFSVDVRTGELSLDETIRTRYQPFDLALLDSEPVNLAKRFSFIVEDEKDQFRVLRADTAEIKHMSQSSLENKKATNGAVYAAVVGANGRFVYKAYKDAGKPEKSGIAVYRIDPLSGALRFLSEHTFTLGFAPTELAMAIGGRFLYAINSSINSLGVFAVDSESGALSLAKDEPPKTGKGPAAIALDPAGRFSFVANARDDSVSVFTHRRIFSAAMYPINRDGSAFPAGDNPVALSVDPTGKFLFVANKDSNNISAYTIHYHEGKLSEVKGSPFASGVAPVSLAIRPDGKFAYVVNADSADVVSYKVDTVTGQLKMLSQRVDAGKQPVSIDLDSEGLVAYVRNKGTSVLRKYTVDVASGQLTFSGELDFGLKVSVVH
jgi:6-phosphogluconolactonase (cycloisomerase 2 family)